MTKEELKERMAKDIKEVFNTDTVINFIFSLVQDAYEKGLETGMRISSDDCNYFFKKE